MVYAQAGNGTADGRNNPTPADYFHSLPIVTKAWWGATAILTLSVNFGVVDGYHVAWIWKNVSTKMEIWRCLTAFCYAGPFSISTLIFLYMMWQFSKLYESGVPFNTGGGGGTSDYAFCLILGVIGILTTYPLLEMIGFGQTPVFCDNLVYYVLYVWSKKNPNDNSNIWGFPIQGVYLPFAYLGLTVLQGHAYEGMVHGMAVGHLYYFLADVVPIIYGKDVLQTPGFLIDRFGYFDFAAPTEPTRRSSNNNRFGTINGMSNRGDNGNNNSTSTGFAGRRSGDNNGGDNNGGGGNRSHDWGSGGNRLGNN
mmetsp:Transcript_7677/g.18937  ORF Transcript_7677/g.18937 Transcript_7677/m.18937 type:complete len:309 (-) Transcript_7677:135-1061(-)